MVYESLIEESIIELLQELDYELIDERYSWIKERTLDKFINEELLFDCISKINNTADSKIIEQAILAIKRIDNPSLFERNLKFHKFLVDGITIEAKEYKINPLIKIIDFDNPENNVFQVCHQVRFNEGRNTRIPDVIIYINGIPLVVMELKSFDEEATEATLGKAYEQLGGNSRSSGYRYDIPTLFNYNAFLVISDGVTTKVGTLTSKIDRYNEWKSIDGEKGYININNLNTIIKSDENDHDNLGRTFHALNTFTAAMEKFANEFDDVEVEKFTTSRLHFYIPIEDNSDSVINEMLELIAFARTLTNFINKSSKYQSLVNFKIGAGADYGKYTEFPFEDNDSGLKEMTTIGSPANRAAKLQSLCDDGKVLISKEVYQMLPKSMNGVFFNNDKVTLELKRKYYDLSAYETEIVNISVHLDGSYEKKEERGLEYASTVANNLNLKDISISDVRNKLSFDNLSISNIKDVEEAAILFADIRGFTKKVDENNLPEMKQFTQTVLTMMNKAVRDRNGVHVQFQGDRESAVFNHYSDESDDYALRAILSAMRMLDGIDKINESREDKLNIGIGCSLGEIYATRIGMKKKEKKFNVTMGQTVKEADDAEDNVAGVGIESKASEIAITSDMYDYLVAKTGREAKLIQDNFEKRKKNNKSYYVSTLRLSRFQSMLNSASLQQNASRAERTSGLRPWGCN